MRNQSKNLLRNWLQGPSGPFQAWMIALVASDSGGDGVLSPGTIATVT